MALDVIVAHKREEVAARKRSRPLTAVRDGLAPSDRSLEKALSKPRTGFILELKKASPSRGLIREDFDPVALARCYEEVGDAISVLTDARFFQGSLEYVKQVREAVSLPVLCKDFILEPYQVYEARSFGADAILLMLSVLSDEEYRVCSQAAQSLNVDVLTEAHDAAELQRAVDLGARIIGINNRNLKTLEVDLEVSRDLCPTIPADRIAVVESGIASHADVRSLRDRCHAFLVGSSLMSEPDVAKACRELIFGRVKVCGLTRPEDARAARSQGAVLGGLIFAGKSPRFVSSEQARAVRDSAPLDWVGVFVNEKCERVARVAQELSLAAVQLHGDEGDDYLFELSTLLRGERVIWKALPVGNTLPELHRAGADLILLDTASEKARGGTGESFDWSLLEGQDLSGTVIAGGLKPENAARADAFSAYALDVSSGVEQAPGIKSEELLRRFFGELRGRRG